MAVLAPTVGCEASLVREAAARHGVALSDNQVAAVVAWHSQPSSVPDMIRAQWAGTGHEERAVRIAKCESGFKPSARNGQYKGVFQMGTREFATYGHGDPYDARANIAAAYAYWKRSGWKPWECKG